MFHIKKKDKVVILSGKDKGKTGEVLKCYPKSEKIIVAKINFIKRHTRSTQTDPGGIREKEAPMHVSKVQLICTKCGKPSRIHSEQLSDGKKVRVCKKCGEMIV